MSDLECSNCGGKAQMFLCPRCCSSLEAMLLGLTVGDSADGERAMPGWLEYLDDSVRADTRLGLSERRSSDFTRPLPFDPHASGLFDEVRDLLAVWANAVRTRKGDS